MIAVEIIMSWEIGVQNELRHFMTTGIKQNVLQEMEVVRFFIYALYYKITGNILTNPKVK
jgi:hypothetical protein